jgi:hypothetical protein
VLALWAVLFLICAGLGYPSLRRFDPRDPRTNFDHSHALYHAQALGDAQEASEFSTLVHYRYRLLVPALARPFARLGQGRVGTWEPGYFGLLVANAFFCSATALLLFVLARDLLGSSARALHAPLFYLLTFGVANYHLAGLVDTGEACVMTALVWCLHRGYWFSLPLLGVVGALAKETFVPFSFAFAAGWIVLDARAPRAAFGWLLLEALAGLATLTTLFSIGNGRLVFLWEIGRSGTTAYGLVQRTTQLAGDLGLVYLFGWLFPLGAPGLRRCPTPWLGGAAACAATVVGLGIFNGEPGVSRSLFDVLGPLLSVGCAATIAQLFPDQSPASA